MNYVQQLKNQKAGVNKIINHCFLNDEASNNFIINEVLE